MGTSTVATARTRALDLIRTWLRIKRFGLDSLVITIVVGVIGSGCAALLTKSALENNISTLQNRIALLQDQMAAQKKGFDDERANYERRIGELTAHRDRVWASHMELVRLIQQHIDRPDLRRMILFQIYMEVKTN